MVEVPAGWLGLQGPDGRMVAVPPGKVGVPNRAGRIEPR